MQKVTLPQVRRQALKWYKAGLLIAQMPKAIRKITYQVDMYRCAIGTALNNKTLKVLRDRNAFDGVFVDGIAQVDPPEDQPYIMAIGKAHDDWAQAIPPRANELEKIFLALIS